MKPLLSLIQILSKPMYLALVIVVGFLVFTSAIIIPNVAAVSSVFQSSVTLSTKIQFMFSLYGSIGTNFTLISATYTVLIATFFGIQIALLTYYIRKARGGVMRIKGLGAMSLGGIISGALGIGCAACGTFILTSVLALFGGAGVLAYLPFGGEEFGIIGAGLLTYSIYLLLKKIDKPLTCPT